MIGSESVDWGPMSSADPTTHIMDASPKHTDQFAGTETGAGCRIQRRRVDVEIYFGNSPRV